MVERESTECVREEREHPITEMMENKGSEREREGEMNGGRERGHFKRKGLG